MEDQQRSNHRGRPTRGVLRTGQVHNTNLNTSNSPKHLKTLYTNTDNSLLSKYDELHARIAMDTPDIICISEIKPKNGQTPVKEQLEINGYDLILSPEYLNNTTRGVCIYTKLELNAMPVINNTTELFKDSVWVSIPGSNNRNLLVGCVYRSGSQEKAIPLDPNLHRMITSMALNKKFTEVLITGDFNHPNINWTPSPIIPHNHAPDHPDIKFVECLQDSYLFQHIDQPTRYRDKQQPTIDDLILSTDELLVDDIKYESHVGKSDHITLSFAINFDAHIKLSRTQKSYKYHKTDLIKMKEMFEVDWASMLADKSAEEGYQIFLNKYDEVKRECVPMEESKSGSGFIKPIWMRHSTAASIIKKHQAWSKFLLTKHPSSKEEYRKERNNTLNNKRQNKL